MMPRDKFLMGYTFNADTYCYKCGHYLPEIDNDGNDKGVIASWHVEELSVFSCGKCGESVKNWRVSNV